MTKKLKVGVFRIPVSYDRDTPVPAFVPVWPLSSRVLKRHRHCSSSRTWNRNAVTSVDNVLETKSDINSDSDSGGEVAHGRI